MKYKRILLKLSGEALMGEQGHGIDPLVVTLIADQVKAIQALGVEVGLVIGGGNIFRGVAGATKGMDRVTADHMGMLATMINALALQDALEQKCVVTRVHVRHRRAQGGRELHPAAGHAAHGKGPGGDLRGGHRQPLLLHRHRRRPAGQRDRRRSGDEGHQRGRRLHRGSQEGPPATKYEQISFQEVLSNINRRRLSHWGGSQDLGCARLRRTLHPQPVHLRRRDARLFPARAGVGGRSFVQPRYWGMRSPGLSVVRNLGAYLRRHPDIRYLFGPVSISDGYPRTARNLLVHFYWDSISATRTGSPPRAPATPSQRRSNRR